MQTNKATVVLFYWNQKSELIFLFDIFIRYKWTKRIFKSLNAANPLNYPLAAGSFDLNDLPLILNLHHLLVHDAGTRSADSNTLVLSGIMAHGLKWSGKYILCVCLSCACFFCFFLLTFSTLSDHRKWLNWQWPMTCCLFLEQVYNPSAPTDTLRNSLALFAEMKLCRLLPEKDS